MQEKYDQQKIINENNLSQIKKDRIIRNVLIALIILSFIIALSYSFPGKWHVLPPYGNRNLSGAGIFYERGKRWK